MDMLGLEEMLDKLAKANGVRLYGHCFEEHWNMRWIEGEDEVGQKGCGEVKWRMS